MPPADIHLTDWHRIFFGIVPAVYFIELLIRALFFYFVIMVCMRLMGKRMSAQLSRNEMMSMVALAAATGIPLTAPDKGIIPGLISCMVIVFGEWIISFLTSRYKRIETLTEGHLSALICDGVIQPAALKETGLSTNRLLSQLRSYGLKHLGSVKRLYFEENGSFTLVKDPIRKTGLSILPPEDIAFRNMQHDDAELLCSSCGANQKDPLIICPNCKGSNFEKAICDQ
jgi:uncharacterized membrane protein YcaP (DUF421 family)